MAVFFKFVNPNVQSASLRRGDTLFSKFDGLSGYESCSRYERSPLSVSCSLIAEFPGSKILSSNSLVTSLLLTNR